MKDIESLKLMAGLLALGMMNQDYAPVCSSDGAYRAGHGFDHAKRSRKKKQRQARKRQRHRK